MLPRAYRLTKKKDFERVFKKGDSFFTPLFIFRAMNNDLPATRFAFVVSNKVAKRANKRNLIKRRMRAAVGTVISALVPGKDVIIVGSQKIMSGGEPAPFAEIEKTILFGLHKIKALR